MDKDTKIRKDRPARPKVLESEPKKWKQSRDRNKGQYKVKTHVSLDPHIYLIAKNTGNISAFLNEAAKVFVTSDEFKLFIEQWREKSSGI